MAHRSTPAMTADLAAYAVPALLLALLIMAADAASASPGAAMHQRPAVAACSRMCPCADGSMFCAGMGYSEMPRDIRLDVTYINFQENALAELNRTTLEGLTSLQRLLLSANRIERLAAGAFRHVRRLTSLDLSLNRLSSLPAGIFSPLRQLTHLNLAYNRLTSVDDTALDGLSRLRTLSLHNNRIVSLEAPAFADVGYSLRYLDLSSNAITELPDNAFSRLKTLTHLLLSNNPIGVGNGSRGNGTRTLHLSIRSPYVRQLACRNCSLTAVPSGLPRSLADLNLAENRIRVVRRAHFARLVGLVSIDLSYNTLVTVDPKSFRNSPRLERLLLHSNRLTELRPAVIPDALVTLRLDNNAIETLDRSMFARSGRLQELGLAHNALRRLHPALFVNLSRLRSLTLNRNFIAHLPQRVFANLTRLTTLDLSDNPLTELPYGAFQGLTNLDSLRLCHIRTPTHIEGPLLVGTSSLRILDLDSSPAIAAAMLAHDLRLYNLRSVQYFNLMRAGLSALDPTFPQYLPSVRVLQLSDNPWHCNRSLYWLQRWLTTSAGGGGMTSVHHREHMRCSSPRELAGKRVLDLQPTDWVIQEQREGLGPAAVALGHQQTTAGPPQLTPDHHSMSLMQRLANEVSQGTATRKLTGNEVLPKA